MRSETSSRAFGTTGAFGPSGTLAVARLNAASAASRGSLGRRVLSGGLGIAVFTARRDWIG
jgi:hypothetical protein